MPLMVTIQPSSLAKLSDSQKLISLMPLEGSLEVTPLAVKHLDNRLYMYTQISIQSSSNPHQIVKYFESQILKVLRVFEATNTFFGCLACERLHLHCFYLCKPAQGCACLRRLVHHTSELYHRVNSIKIYKFRYYNKSSLSFKIIFWLKSCIYWPCRFDKSLKIIKKWNLNPQPLFQKFRFEKRENQSISNLGS